VPKRDLIAEVQAEGGKLKIGKVREGGRLLRELGGTKMSVSGAGCARIGADVSELRAEERLAASALREVRCGGVRSWREV